MENILEIAKFNNFPINKIYQLNQQIKNKINNNKKTTLCQLKDKPKQYYGMTYFGQISEIIKKTFLKHNIAISFSIPNKNQILLKNSKLENQYDNESGIYKLACSCNSIYIGKTFRKFKQRINEHYRSFIYNMPEKSNFSAHLLHPSHDFVSFPNNYQIIKIIPNKRNIDLYEDLEIMKHRLKFNLLNEQLPNLNNPLYKLLESFHSIYNYMHSQKTKQLIQYQSPKRTVRNACT